MELRPLVGALVVALLITTVSYRVRALSGSGASAAFLVGAVSLSAGWRWGAFLILWFGSASILSRVGTLRKAKHVNDTIDKQGARDARQVLANGAVFAGCALASHLWPDPRWPVAAAAALAAAGADTWATEFGTWIRSHAWSLRTMQRVAAGTSGAVTAVGTTALLVGAAAYSSLALAIGFVRQPAWIAVAVGATCGAIADTFVGAWVQERRWCPRCDRGTEQLRHQCGERTEVIGGVSGLDNDVVNTLATIIGASVAAFLYQARHIP